HRKRKQFPAKHTFSMTSEVADGRDIAVATCKCGHVIKFGANDQLRVDASIEAHWRRHGNGPMIDGRGQPIRPGDGSRIPGASGRSRKSSDEGGEASAAAQRPAGTCDPPAVASSE